VFKPYRPGEGEDGGYYIDPETGERVPSGEPSDVIPDRGYRNYLFYPPILSPLRKYHMVIYSRLGIMLYETFDHGKGWNGYYRGKLCDEGVYIYKIEGVFETGQSFSKIGDILLLR
jgi:hypothetical protein